ncbi:UNVERIFIED_CONTAM: hypothetical protein H355_014030, partial [Colinus virginianus]
SWIENDNLSVDKNVDDQADSSSIRSREGAALLVSLIGKSVIHQFHFHKRVHSVSFSPDGKCFAVGSKDMSTWVFGAERWENLIYYSLGGHKDIIVACFFEENSLDLYTVSQDGALCVWQCDTELDDLKPMPPKEARQKKRIKEEDGFLEEPKGEEIHGKANPNEQEIREKVKYTRVANISDQRIASISINSTGDWIAFGCSGLGQLLVWEWQSESYVLKQQGHFNSMVSLAYSPDGQYIVTGGEDGKVKVWNTSSSFCFVTFTDHNSGITAVTFTSSGYVILSASLDGTVRAFDLHRYRNFRTFTSPRPTQFSCLAVDSSGEIVSAGSQDSFEIFIWSMQSGRLLDVLSGHEGPISSLSFNPMKCVLASGSWDKTVKLWDMVDSWRTKETLMLNSDVLVVAFRPDGKELAVASLNGQITFWDPENAVQEYLDRRKMTEFGSMALIDEGAGDEDGVAIPLPGVRTGRSWAATTTEGLLIYSLDSGLIFDPFELDIDVTPSNIRKKLHQKEFTMAIVMALKLNEKKLIQEVLSGCGVYDGTEIHEAS